MSTSVTFNGSSFIVPAVGDASWGVNVSNYLIALSTGSLQKTGGAFTLSTADVSFGATYGLQAVYFKSNTSGIAQSGILRLANADVVSWRNNAGNADLTLSLSTNTLQFNSISLVDVSTAQTLTNKTLTSPTLTTPALGTPASGVLTNCTGLPATSGITGTLPVGNGGTGVTSSTGSGSNVLSISPTLVTPALGTPASGVLTNATGLPLTTGVTGTLGVTNGGTGVTTSTGSGNNVLSTSPTLVTPALGTPSSGTLTSCTGLPLTTGVTGTLGTGNGGTGMTSVTTTPSASSFAGWDANKNLSAANHIEGYSTTATAAGTTTLMVGSNYLQYFTGSTTQTVQLPVASTLVLGQQFQISNASTGNVTVQSSGGNTVVVVGTNASAVLTCILTSGTGTASWSYQTVTATAGTVTSVAMTVPAGLAISGSPVTTTGTLGLTWSGTVPAAQIPAATTSAAGAVSAESTPSSEASLPTITWSATTAPSGGPTASAYKWTQVGKVVTLWWRILYSSGGSGITQGYFILPGACPAPVKWAYNTGLGYSYVGSSTLVGSGFGGAQNPTTGAVWTFMDYGVLSASNWTVAMTCASTNSGYQGWYGMVQYQTS